jgi:enamine deaminase RidA (YjgF/YER057c/UK114 family)
LPFSDPILVGRHALISGRIGTDPATDMAAVRMHEELRSLIDEFEAVLARANMTMDDLVSVQIPSPTRPFGNTSTWPMGNALRKALPARGFIGSGRLLKGGRFQMMGIAVRR